MQWLNSGVNMLDGDHIHNDNNKFGLHNHKKIFVCGIFALILALAAYSLAQNAQDTADINNVLEIVVNNTNLAPSVAGHPPGTGERVNGVTYWANDSPIEVFVFAHASTPGATAEIHLFINGTKVADTSGRPLGAAEESNKTIIAMIPKGANYSFEFNNAHHYEWREYPVLSGKNGTLSVNQTFITNGSSFNATYAANISALQANDTYFNGTVFPQSTNFRNDSLNDTVLRNYTKHIKVGNFSHDISVTGAQSITNIGFKPSAVAFTGLVPNTAYSQWGYDDGTSHVSVFDSNAVTTDTYDISTSLSINFRTGVGVGSGASITSFDDDGFTLNWVKAGSPTGTATVLYMAYR